MSCTLYTVHLLEDMFQLNLSTFEVPSQDKRHPQEASKAS